jgi:hypothetical protein
MNELRYVMHDVTIIMFHDYARMNLCTFMFKNKNKSTRCYMISIRHGLEQVKSMIPVMTLGFLNRPV